jgi:hypothetical protein
LSTAAALTFKSRREVGGDDGCDQRREILDRLRELHDVHVVGANGCGCGGANGGKRKKCEENNLLGE